MNSSAREIRRVTDENVPAPDENLEVLRRTLPPAQFDAIMAGLREYQAANPSVGGGVPDQTASETARYSQRLETEWQRVRAFLPDNMENQFLAEFKEQHDLQRNAQGVWSQDPDQDTHAPVNTYLPNIVLPPDERSR